MKTPLLLLILVFLSFNAFAQTAPTDQAPVPAAEAPVVVKETPATVASAPAAVAATDAVAAPAAVVAQAPIAVADVVPTPAVAASPVVAAVPAAAAVPVVELSAERKALVLKFIDVFGTRQAMKDNLAAMFESMPADDPKTQKLKDGVNVEDILSRLVPLYAAKFSDDQLNAFITFYSSVDGQKLLKEIPQIMQESVDVTAKYFDEKFPEMNAEDKAVSK